MPISPALALLAYNNSLAPPLVPVKLPWGVQYDGIDQSVNLRLSDLVKQAGGQNKGHF